MKPLSSTLIFALFMSFFLSAQDHDIPDIFLPGSTSQHIPFVKNRTEHSIDFGTPSIYACDVLKITYSLNGKSGSATAISWHDKGLDPTHKAEKIKEKLNESIQLKNAPLTVSQDKSTLKISPTGKAKIDKIEFQNSTGQVKDKQGKEVEEKPCLGFVNQDIDSLWFSLKGIPSGVDSDNNPAHIHIGSNGLSVDIYTVRGESLDNFILYIKEQMEIIGIEDIYAYMDSEGAYLLIWNVASLQGSIVGHYGNNDTGLLQCFSIVDEPFDPSMIETYNLVEVF